MTLKIAAPLAALGACAAATLLHATTPSPTSKAYIVGTIEVSDTTAYARDYAPRVAATMAPWRGRYLARGGRVERLEGEAPAGRVVIIEFPSLGHALGYYRSPAYQALAPVRQLLSRGDIFVVEGLPR